jgi:hypothetical protein
VPKYQRSYAWEDEELKEFVSDLERAYSARQKDLAHATAEGIADDGPLIHHGLTLEVFVAGKRDRFPDSLLGLISNA